MPFYHTTNATLPHKTGCFTIRNRHYHRQKWLQNRQKRLQKEVLRRCKIMRKVQNRGWEQTRRRVILHILNKYVHKIKLQMMPYQLKHTHYPCSCAYIFSVSRPADVNKNENRFNKFRRPFVNYINTNKIDKDWFYFPFPKVWQLTFFISLPCMCGVSALISSYIRISFRL